MSARCGLMRHVAAMAAVTAGLSACSLVTGSTDGYRTAAGASCAGDGGCAELALGCANCEGGAPICCLEFASSSSPAAACAAATCSGPFSAQLCGGGTACPADAGCVSQRCPFGGSMITLHACGEIPSCTPE
jgi:hypothetical protein